MAATAPAERLDPKSVLWLVAALAMVAAPHLERLPLWLSALVGMLAAWRLYLLYFGLRLPSRWLLAAIAAAAVIGVFLGYGRLFGRDAGVALLVVMLALKMLELAAHRDAMVLTFLAYFLIITNFLYSQTIPTALYMLAVLWVITATMTGFQFRGRRPGARAQMKSAGILLVQAAPLALVLFLFFPRAQGPLWGLPQDTLAGMSGLSDSMSPGTLSRLILSDSVAFRVKFVDRVPNAPLLYWRGPILWDFDGTTWTAPRIPYLLKREFVPLGAQVSYSVTVEPHNNRWLFALDLPMKTPPRAFMTTDYQLLWPGPVVSRVRYDMTSALEYRTGADETSYEVRRGRQLPAGLNPRTAELARELRAQAGSDREYINAVLRYFREQPFSYTLEPPLLEGPHPVDRFLFETRAGFCEHYASAFTVMVRAAGIPARVVTGYQGGEVNPVGDYMIVRQADAHAWSEVWLGEDGWVRVDPTGAVSPARVQIGISNAMPLTESLPGLGRGNYPWLQSARLRWDSLANTWNQFVLGYGIDRQQQLLSRVGLDDATWQTLAVIMLAAVAAVTALLALLTLRRLRRGVRDPVLRAWDAFCARMAERHLAREPQEGPLDYARRVAPVVPDLAPRISAISHLYADLRYGPRAPSEDVQRLRRMVAAFRP
ncbi:MAG: transglutaminase TgpA family protein [Burkholderiales bacterium]